MIEVRIKFLSDNKDNINIYYVDDDVKFIADMENPELKFIPVHDDLKDSITYLNKSLIVLYYFTY